MVLLAKFKLLNLILKIKFALKIAKLLKYF